MAHGNAKVSEIANAAMDILRVPMFNDNYGWILRDKASGKVAAVDPAEPTKIQDALRERNWSLDFILNTHHHFDHVGGNSYLQSEYGCKIIGPAADAQRIPCMDEGVGDGDTVSIGDLKFKVFDTPGHTRGHITFFEDTGAALFPGDTLFSLGCGRLFEGSPDQMWTSLKQFRGLPHETKVFCAHEYTQANAKWAVTVDPQNSALVARQQKVDSLRSQGLATVPMLLGDELNENPFLRPDSTSIRQHLGVAEDASDEHVFALLRSNKDNF